MFNCCYIITKNKTNKCYYTYVSQLNIATAICIPPLNYTFAVEWKARHNGICQTLLKTIVIINCISLLQSYLTILSQRYLLEHFVTTIPIF